MQKIGRDDDVNAVSPAEWFGVQISESTGFYFNPTSVAL